MAQTETQPGPAAVEEAEEVAVVVGTRPEGEDEEELGETGARC